MVKLIAAGSHDGWEGSTSASIQLALIYVSRICVSRRAVHCCVKLPSCADSACYYFAPSFTCPHRGGSVRTSSRRPSASHWGRLSALPSASGFRCNRLSDSLTLGRPSVKRAGGALVGGDDAADGGDVANISSC